MLNAIQKISFAPFFGALFFIFCANIFSNAQITSKDCDFSKYKPIAMSHFLPNAIVEQVKPVYPSAAKAIKAEGKVRVKIIVDLRGRVREACVVEGHPLLRNAALRAARESRFKPNFGLTLPQKRHGKRFITDELIYDFTVT